jgi:hypothetical protein
MRNYKKSHSVSTVRRNNAKYRKTPHGSNTLWMQRKHRFYDVSLGKQRIVGKRIVWYRRHKKQVVSLRVTFAVYVVAVLVFLWLVS